MQNKHNIKILVMDVDGTLTDGKIYMGNDGEIMKAFHVKDGYAIHNLLPSANILPIIITGRNSKIVENRCKELGITRLYQGIENKKAVLEQLLAELNCSYADVAYIGDDLNDYSCMQEIKSASGIIGCPADAVQEVIDIADYVCKKNGGEGAVREFIEAIIK